MKGSKHPTGFTKYYLLKFFGFQLRLHMWWDGMHSGQPHIHDHRWSFFSLPLWGSFFECTFERLAPGQECPPTKIVWQELVHCYSENDHAHARVEPTHSSRYLRFIEEKTRRAGRPYFFPAFKLHSYGPLGPGFHASLVLTFPPKREHAEVYLPMELKP